mgnify:CR=1 FL=1
MLKTTLLRALALLMLLPLLLSPSMAEKSLPYAVLRKIVASSSAAEYTKVSLAVVEREQAFAGLAGA